MARKPNIPFAPAASPAADVALRSIRSDSRFYAHPNQSEEAGYAANYICKRNGRTLAVEKTQKHGVCIIVADDDSFATFKDVPPRKIPNYDPSKRDFGMNSNLEIAELSRYRPAGFRIRTPGEALKLIEVFGSLPRLT